MMSLYKLLITAASLFVLSSAVYAQGAYKNGDYLEQEEHVYKASNKIVKGYKEISWEELMPKDWDPMKPLEALNVDELDDGDPRAMQALKKAQEFWEQAPINPQIKGTKVRLPGFVVTLEETRSGLKEFLLVPYFGACIHTPPPPANQIIHVTLQKPVKGFHTMDPVWIHGEINIQEHKTSMGKSGYALTATHIEAYTDHQ